MPLYIYTGSRLCCFPFQTLIECCLSTEGLSQSVRHSPFEGAPLRTLGPRAFTSGLCRTFVQAAMLLYCNLGRVLILFLFTILFLVFQCPGVAGNPTEGRGVSPNGMYVLTRCTVNLLLLFPRAFVWSGPRCLSWMFLWGTGVSAALCRCSFVYSRLEQQVPGRSGAFGGGQISCLPQPLFTKRVLYEVTAQPHGIPTQLCVKARRGG